jgi:hypothetical protein
LPVAVEPVNEIRSTSGSLTSNSPIALSKEEITFQHARRQRGSLDRDDAEARGAERGVQSRLEHHRVARGQPRDDLAEHDLHRVVPRGDARDDADGLLANDPPAREARSLVDAEVALQLELVDVVDRPLHGTDRGTQLEVVHPLHRRAALGDQLVPELVLGGLQRVLELLQDALAQLAVRRTVRGVERLAGGGDRRGDVLASGSAA